MNAPGGRDRTCILHVGTFKTGTTAIQRYLTENADVLARLGLYVPQAGSRDGAFGHHNLASELLQNDDFDPRRGGVSAVAAEIARSGLPIAVVSSEAIGLMHRYPDALARLRDAFASAGYGTRVVFYVRAQPDYLESLYAEAMKHGYVERLLPLVDELVETGALVRRNQVTLFDYGKLAEHFSDVFGHGAVWVRGFRSGASPETAIADFFRSTGIVMPEPSTIAAPPARENMRATTGAVIERLFANAAALRGDAALAELGARYVARRPDLAGAPFAPLTPADRERIRARFSESNRRLQAAYGVAPETFEPKLMRAADERDALLARSFFAGAQLVLG